VGKKLGWSEAGQSYPFGYERIAQLFDSPHAPDLIVSPKDWAFGIQPGTHGALHVRQARAPLGFAGAGVVAGLHDRAARAIDIAPTLLAALKFPKIDGADASGRTSSQRGHVEQTDRCGDSACRGSACHGSDLHDSACGDSPVAARIYTARRVTVQLLAS
jgi:hypothetical protein